MSYRQLTPEQRYQIYACLRMGMNRSRIAEEIGVHRSTISRELRRNEYGRRKYNPSRACRLTRERHERKKKYRIDPVTWARVESLLKLEWRPEQISVRLKVENFPTVSHETIYQHIYQNKRQG